MRNVNSRMNGTRIGIKIVIDVHPHHQRAILAHLEMKMTGTLNADLRTTLNLGSQERSGINSESMTDWAYERVASSIMTSGLPVEPPTVASELVSDFLSLLAEQDAENEADADNGLEFIGVC